MAIRGYVDLQSCEKLDADKIEIASIGGFSLIKNGKEIYFDWEESYGGKTYNSDGTVTLKWELRNFDEDFFNDSNKGINASEVTVDFFRDTELTEVYYEAGDDDIAFPFKLICFEIVDIDDYIENGETKDNIYAFSEEQINKFNQEYGCYATT